MVRPSGQNKVAVRGGLTVTESKSKFWFQVNRLLFHIPVNDSSNLGCEVTKYRDFYKLGHLTLDLIPLRVLPHEESGWGLLEWWYS